MASTASLISGLTAALGHLGGWAAIAIIAALVFGETAIFLGFVLPGEAAVVFGGVLASRGHLSLPALIGAVVVSAVAGPLVGYEVGRRMGDRLFTSRRLSRISGHLHRARTTLRDRGGLAVIAGRFVAVIRALMPAAAGAAEVPYRVFAISNLIGGVAWGVGYSLLGYVAGSAYGVVERTVGTGLAIAAAVVVVGVAAAWAWRRHRRAASMSAAGSAVTAEATARAADDAAAGAVADAGAVPAAEAVSDAGPARTD